METRLDRAYRKDRLDVAERLEEELDVPPFPDEFAQVWEAWTRVRNRKAPGLNGPVQIEWPDIDAFIRTTRTDLEPFEVFLVENLDNLYLTAVASGPSDEDEQQAIKDGLRSIEKA